MWESDMQAEVAATGVQGLGQDRQFHCLRPLATGHWGPGHKLPFDDLLRNPL